MDEEYLPWWLILLLGMWVASFAVWQHPRVHREIRVWSGVATWVYLLLIFVALAIGLTSLGFTLIPRNLVQAGLVLCVATGLAASVWMRGQFSERSQNASYVVFTLASAGICLLIASPWMAAGLCLVSILAAQPLIREFVQDWRSRMPGACRQRWLSLIQFRPEPDRADAADTFWLTGVLNGILACVLIGTLAYSIRVETTRMNHSPRFSAFPSRESLERLHRRLDQSPSPSLPSELPAPESPMPERSFGSRVDLIVLLAAIVFLRLGMSLDELSRAKVASTTVEPGLPTG